MTQFIYSNQSREQSTFDTFDSKVPKKRTRKTKNSSFFNYKINVIILKSLFTTISQ